MGRNERIVLKGSRKMNTYFTFCIICSIICYFINLCKRRNKVLGLIFGFLFNLPAVLICSIVSEKKED